MMTPEEVTKRAHALEAFREVKETYEKMKCVVSVCLYYYGHPTSAHSSDNPVSIVVKRELIKFYRERLNAEWVNLREMGIDASAEMPKDDDK